MVVKIKNLYKSTSTHPLSILNLVEPGGFEPPIIPLWNAASSGVGTDSVLKPLKN